MKDLKIGQILKRKYPLKEKCKILDIKENFCISANAKFKSSRMFCFKGFMCPADAMHEMFEL